MALLIKRMGGGGGVVKVVVCLYNCTVFYYLLVRQFLVEHTFVLNIYILLTNGQLNNYYLIRSSYSVGDIFYNLYNNVKNLIPGIEIVSNIIILIFILLLNTYVF